MSESNRDIYNKNENAGQGQVHGQGQGQGQGQGHVQEHGQKTMPAPQMAARRRGGFGGGHGPGGFGMPAEKAKNFRKSLSRLIGYLRPHRINLAIVLVFAILSTVFSIASPKVMSKAFNKLQDGYISKMLTGNLIKAQNNAIDQFAVQLGKQQKNIKNTMGKLLSGAGAASGMFPKGTASAGNTPAGNTPAGNTPAGSTQAGNVPAENKPSVNMPSVNIPSISMEAMLAIKEFLDLPDIDTIKNRQEKKMQLVRMLDLLEKFPDMESFSTISGNQSGVKTDDNSQASGAKEKDSSDQTKDNAQVTKEDMKLLKQFLSLPLLENAKTGDQKADICKSFLDLGKKLPAETVKNMGMKEGTGNNITLTDSQIEGAIKAVRETNAQYDFGYIGMIALILIGMYLVSSVFSLVMGLVMSGVSQKTVYAMRKEVNLKLNKLSLKYFDMHAHGDVLSRVTNDIDTISATLQQSLTQIITSLITIVGYIIMMLTISPVLTLIVVATLPFYMAGAVIIAKKSQKYFKAQQTELGTLSGHVEEMYTGHKIVKAFGHEQDSIKKFGDTNEKLYSSGWKAQFVSGILFPLMNFVSNIGYVFICIVGGIWITKDLLKIGDILAFIQYSRSFSFPIIQTANIANVIQSTVACAERVFEILDEEEEIPDSEDAKSIQFPKGEVSISNVDFRYVEEVPLINNMNLEVRQGQTIAIVGPTGAGKTTLVNLLMRFYEINAGRISIDGLDIRDMKRFELRKLFGMVLQDTWLFNGTIKDNIAYGKENATMDEIVRAARAAHADHFIRTLPDGYNTVLNEEATNISQGQKQLLTIARAVLADPAILILDEATSNVDTRTEVLIQKAMSNLMKNRTSFVIAHRLSTIRDAETILVMNHGSIIEVGNHKELLQRGGFYADLYKSQFTGANLESTAV